MAHPSDSVALIRWPFIGCLDGSGYGPPLGRWPGSLAAEGHRNIPVRQRVVTCSRRRRWCRGRLRSGWRGFYLDLSTSTSPVATASQPTTVTPSAITAPSQKSITLSAVAPPSQHSITAAMQPSPEFSIASTSEQTTVAATTSCRLLLGKQNTRGQ